MEAFNPAMYTIAVREVHGNDVFLAERRFFAQLDMHQSRHFFSFFMCSKN